MILIFFSPLSSSLSSFLLYYFSFLLSLLLSPLYSVFLLAAFDKVEPRNIFPLDLERIEILVFGDAENVIGIRSPTQVFDHPVTVARDDQIDVAEIDKTLFPLFEDDDLSVPVQRHHRISVQVHGIRTVPELRNRKIDESVRGHIVEQLHTSSRSIHVHPIADAGTAPGAVPL